VDHLADVLQQLAADGVRLVDAVPRPGSRGTRVAFLHPSACEGVLTELVEAPDGR
jgi:methylmalonyl-CoA/ethylmalonyl-CoA epimerase